MILADASYIVAAISEDDQDHERCMALAARIQTPLLTTWPCVTEAMHLLGIPPAQEKLRRQIEQGILILHPATQEDAVRACELMRVYADAPMDFADASLVVAAETFKITRIFTLDRHFYAYRIHQKTPFEVQP